MFIGKVIGTVWATRKVESLSNLRFLLIQPVDIEREVTKSVVVAADPIGAGPGEMVLVSFGRAARLACGNEDLTIEAAVIGIVDSIDINEVSIKKGVEAFDLLQRELEKAGLRVKKKDE